MVDGGGLENRWTKVSRVRILLPPPASLRCDQDLSRVWPMVDGHPGRFGKSLIPPPEIESRRHRLL